MAKSILFNDFEHGNKIKESKEKEKGKRCRVQVS
jgi:hypothetical protein